MTRYPIPVTLSLEGEFPNKKNPFYSGDFQRKRIRNGDFLKTLLLASIRYRIRYQNVLRWSIVFYTKFHIWRYL